MVGMMLFIAMFAFPDGVAAQSGPAKQMVFMTGSPGGSWQVLGGVTKNVLEKKIPQLTITVAPGGSGNNILGVQMGKAGLGLSNSFISVAALRGDPPFKNPTTKIRNLVTLYPQWYQLVVQADSDIYGVKDLKGKRLVTLKAGSAGMECTKDVLSVYGLTFKDLGKVDYQGSGALAEFMVDGHSDAGSSVSPVPASYFSQITENRNVRFIGIGDKIEELNKINGGYLPDVIPAGSYRGQEKDVPTVSNWAHIVVSADMDTQLAYNITKILIENADAIRAMGKAMKDVVPKNMAKYVGVEFHPGAKKYFQEAGLLK